MRRTTPNAAPAAPYSSCLGRLRPGLVYCLATLLAVMVAGCRREAAKGAGAPPRRETVFAVTAAAVEQGRIVESASLIGSVRWLRQATLKSEVAGRVVTLELRAGNRFARQAVLVQLDDRDAQIRLRQAEADLEKASCLLDDLRAGTRREIIAQLDAVVREKEARLQEATDERDRTRTLFEGKVQAEADLVRAEAARAESQALLDQARAKRDEAHNGPRPEALRVAEAEVAVRQVAVDAARRELEKCTVLAPFDGVVLNKQSEVGVYVRPGDPLLEIAAATELECLLEVPERYARHLRPGVRFALRADAFPDAPFEGEVLAIIPLADEHSRSLLLRAAIHQAPDALVAGMFVRADLPVVSRDQARLIPTDAVTLRDDRAVVFTITGDTVERLDVTLGLRDEGRVEVVEPLLEPGIQVVTTGGEVLFPGAKVKVAAAVPSAGPEPPAAN